MCVGSGAVFDSSGKFVLDCAIRELGPDDINASLVPFADIQGYWYETGPKTIFSNFVSLLAGNRKRGEVQEQGEGNSQNTAPRYYLLLKREGETNPWHSLMEIWSSWMTIDVLRMSRDPLHDDAPYFRDPEDAIDTQVVILDKRADGPYFDLWTLFAKRKPIRLAELQNTTQSSPAKLLIDANTNIIIPLAGASNPIWQNDWSVRDCTSAATLTSFSRRVLAFYGIEDPPTPGADDDIVVTFVDRRSHRLLRNQTALFDALKERVPHITVRFVDFEVIPFEEQVRAARETDVLVGVHGAGLTHAMFMRESAGAVVEIQPSELHHLGFRNIAAMRQLDYFRVHGESVAAEKEGAVVTPPPPEPSGNPLHRRSNWHRKDVAIEPDVFLEVMDVAIKSLYAKGLRDYDVM